MKFEHQIIPLGNTGKNYFTLKPRYKKSQDFPCRAIVTDIRGNFYNFLKRPYKKGERLYVFFEGSSLFIIKDEVNNKVYFYDKFSAGSLDKFQLIFDLCTDFEDICESINDLNVLAIHNRNYKGTGKFQKIKIRYEKLKRRTKDYSPHNRKLLDSINQFIQDVDKITSENKSENYNTEKVSFEHIIEKQKDVKENFLFTMSKQVLELERLGGEYLQTESWTEWREALKDWKDFFNRMTLEDHKQTENIYLNEFKRLFELRKISQFDYKTEEKKKTILSNSVSRLIYEVSKIFGVEHDSVINSFKKVYKVKSKEQVFEALINDLIEN